MIGCHIIINCLFFFSKLGGLAEIIILMGRGHFCREFSTLEELQSADTLDCFERKQFGNKCLIKT